MKYQFIQQHREEHAISILCSSLGVSKAGYYDWLRRDESPRAQANRQLLERIKHFHQRSRRIYGSPRIYHDLRAEGECCSKKRVARLMRVAGIESKMVRRFVLTTNSKNTQGPAPDRLQRRFHVARRNEAWVSDTTFIATAQGWMYLAVVLDLYSRQVIGWSMGSKNNSQLVEYALNMAIAKSGNVKGTIIHSDQGSTYASSSYQALINQQGLNCSMSRKGECLDNAVAESFFATLKNELIYHERYLSHREARQSIFEYIEIFYNRERRHSFLNYQTPTKFDRKIAPH